MLIIRNLYKVSYWNNLPMETHNIIVSSEPLANAMDWCVLVPFTAMFSSFFFYFTAFLFFNIGHNFALKLRFDHTFWEPDAQWVLRKEMMTWTVIIWHLLTGPFCDWVFTCRVSVPPGPPSGTQLSMSPWDPPEEEPGLPYLWVLGSQFTVDVQ